MDSRPVVALTGAGGYVGGIIAAALADVARVVSLGRSGGIAWSFGDGGDALAQKLKAAEVTHLVHAAWDMRASSLADQERLSVAGSRALIDAARAAGVTRFVFISTISAFAGARSSYGRSKLAVEKMFLDAGGTVLRLGLVHGAGQGGMFGTIRAAVRKGKAVPMIGRGTAPQYLLDAATLGEVVRRAIAGDLIDTNAPITLARPEPIMFRDLVRSIAAAEARAIVPVPLPWPLLYAALRSAEALGLKLGVRSDSVISFIFQDPAPDFAPMKANSIAPAEPDFAARP